MWIFRFRTFGLHFFALYWFALGFRIRPHLMYWWCFFHNQMYVIHHRNWHLWYYNRFLLINWYMMRAVDIVAPSMAAQVESHTVIFLWPRTRIVCVLYGEPKSKMNVSSCSFFVELLTMKYALPCAQHHNRRYVALLKHQKEKLIYVMVDIFLVALRNGLTRDSSSSGVKDWSRYF